MQRRPADGDINMEDMGAIMQNLEVDAEVNVPCSLEKMWVPRCKLRWKIEYHVYCFYGHASIE